MNAQIQFGLGRYARMLGIGIALLASVPPMQAAPVVLKVAPAQEGKSLASQLEAALELIEKLSGGTWPVDGVTLELPAGVLRLERTLRIGPRHSGRAGAPLVIQGPPAGNAVLSGTTVLGGFAALPAGEATPIAASARASVLRADLPPADQLPLGQLVRQGQGRDTAGVVAELFHQGAPMRLAGWPDDGFTRIVEPIPTGGQARIKLDGGRLAAWAAEPDLWMHGYWGRDWADEWIGIAEVDTAGGALLLRDGPPLYGSQRGQRVRVVNALSELDSPGEWYLDRQRRQVYFWPPSAIDAASTELSRLDNVLRVENASHVHVRQLGIEGARGDAVVVSGGRDVRLERVRIRNAAGRAVRMAGTAHAVVDCDIHDTGQGGLVLWGGDRATLEPAGMLAQGNRIQRVNRWVRTYRPAIVLGGVGNTARANLITDAPHAGLIFYGNDHLIEFNALSQLARETGDVGAIYTGMDWTARGTMIRYNHLHDIRGPGLHGSRGVYLDDQASGITVQGNVFQQVDQPVFMGGGRDNLVDNNLFIASSPAIHLDARGRTWQRAITDDPDGLLRKRLREVPYRGPAYQRYAGLAKLLETAPGQPLGNVARRNAVMDGAPLRLLDQTERELEVDRIFGTADLLFAKGRPLAERSLDGLAALPESPALRAGFAPLPLARMGCTEQRWANVPSGGRPRADAPGCATSAGR